MIDRHRYVNIISVLHGMPVWTSDEKGVCPSVCLSNAWIVTKQKKDLFRFFIPYERSFSLVF